MTLCVRNIVFSYLSCKMAGHLKSLAVRISTLVDKLRTRPRGAGGLDHAIQARGSATTEASDLDMSSAVQVNSLKPVGTQKGKGLLELPLVLVQDILEQLVLQNTQFCRKDRISIQDLLDLRRVNSKFKLSMFGLRALTFGQSFSTAR